MHGEAGETVGEQIRISVKYFARKRICGDGKILEYKFIVYFEDRYKKILCWNWREKIRSTILHVWSRTAPN